MLGKSLVTQQTGPKGKMISRLYVEEATLIEAEFYLSFVLECCSEHIIIVASAAGGMDIEEVAKNSPDAIVNISVEPAVGVQKFQAREIAFALGLEAKQVNQTVTVVEACYRAFRDLDATLVEINPLVFTEDARLVDLDAKMTFDDNALFRRQQISEFRKVI
jgi:malate-CoA ligase subunit beta